jgi:hypothetical protein
MTTFTIDCDNNITVFASLQQAQAADLAGAEYFSSEEELAQLAASWPPTGARGRGSSKLLELWNSLPGVAPVKKFKDRATALARIWKASQALTPPVTPQGAHDAPKATRTPKKATKGAKRATAREGGKKAKTAKAASAKKAAPLRKAKKDRNAGKEGREGSKKAEVLELMRRPKGATLAEIMKATGWQPHTIRGFVSGTLIKKQGLKVESFRSEDKERTYRVSA